MRPGVLQDPAPQLVSEHAACPCSCLPSLATPSLADATADVVDSSSLRFLAASALEARRKVEVEERARRITETEQLLAVPRALRTPEQKRRIDEICAESLASRYSQLARRKRKKRRKKKLPRCTLPRQGCRRLCDHQRQAPTVSQTLGIPVMMQSQVPTVYSFMLPVQFLNIVFDMPVVVLRQVLGLTVQNTVVRPQLQSIEGRRLSLSFSRGSSSWSRLFTRPQRFFSCYSISGCRCPCCSGSCRFSGAAPLALPQLQLVEKSVTFSVPLYLTVTCTVPYSVLLGSRVDYTLGVSLRGLLASTLHELQILRSCSSSSVVDTLLVPQRQIPMVQTVQQTTEIPQMPFVFRWSMPLLCRSCGSTGCSSPYTAHCLVRQRIHAVRQSTEYFIFYVNWWILRSILDLLFFSVCLVQQ